MNTLVLGIGNLLLADEGVGVHTAQALIGRGTAEGVTVMDIGTAILEALPALEAADKVVVVDAVKAGMDPGTVYRIDYNDCMRPSCIASMHGFDLSRVLALTRRKTLPPIVVIGVEPERIEWSMELSPSVRQALPAVIKSIEAEFV